MAAVYGHVGPFEENTEKFADYAGRHEAFMVANETAEDRQVHVFLARGWTTTLQVVIESM